MVEEGINEAGNDEVGEYLSDKDREADEK